MNWFKNKKVTFYSLVTPDQPNYYLTVSNNKDNCREYAEKLLQLQYKEHYTLWCNMRSYNTEDLKAWQEYFDNCISNEDKQQFLIKKIAYTDENLAIILRMFGGCVPLGCSFETSREVDYMKYKMDQESKMLKNKEDTNGEQ